MNKPTVILVQPKHVDYPLCRYNLKRFAPYFHEVLIAITDHGQPADYTKFFMNDMDAKFKIMPRAESPGDWRNIAVNRMLEMVTSEWVLFLEQDFLVRDERFWEILLNVSDYNFIYHEEGNRIHPACILTTRDVINKTSKDFSANPPAYDHFGLFTKQAMLSANGCDLETIGLHNREDYFHLNGLTQNYHAKPYYMPNQFLTYNRLCLTLPIQFPTFIETMQIVDKGTPFFHDAVVASMFPKNENKTL